MKIKTRILSFVLCTVMLLSMCPAMTLAGAATADTKTYRGTTEIATLQQLKDALKIAKSDWRYVLTADIDCGGAELGKIFSLGSGSVLDGDGHSILNFKTGDTDATGRSGIFDLASTGTITFRNLTFGSPEAPLQISNCLVARNPGAAGDPEESIWENVNAYVTLTRTSGGYLGVFYAGSSGNHRFTNCHISVTANSTGSYIGGFFGRYEGESLIFEDCSVSGNLQLNDITSDFSVGGFVGSFGNSSGEGQRSLTMSNCSNKATVSLITSKDGCKAGAGGFVGVIVSTGRYLDVDATFSRCTNFGSVTSNVAAGGLVGYSRNYTPTATFISCVNEGAVNGKSDDEAAVGGIIGKWQGTNEAHFDRCINKAPISAGNINGGLVGYAERGLVSFDSCYNAGTITGKSNAAHVGGLLGYSGESAKFYNCVNSGALKGPGTSVKSLGQIVSEVSGKLTVENCLALGKIGVSATGVGAITTALPTDSTYAGNRFVESNRINKYYCVDKTADVLDETAAAAALQAWLVKGDNGEDCIAIPVLRAVQETEIINNAHTIRLLASIDTQNYRSLGINVQISVNGTVYRQASDMSCTHIYKSVTTVNEKDGTTAAHNAGDMPFSGSYLMTICLADVPTNQGDVEIIATPYTIDQSGVRHDGETVCVTYSYSNGGAKLASVNFHRDTTEALFQKVFSGVLPAYLDGTASLNTYSHGLVLGTTDTNLSDYNMITVSNTTIAAFEAYITDLKNSGFDVFDASDSINNISGYWVEKDNVRAYLYCAVRTGVARFILENEPMQTSLKGISDTYVKKDGDKVTFYMYGLDMINRGGTSMLCVAKLADNSVVLVDGGTKEQMTTAAAAHLNEFLHTITGTPAGQKVTVRAWVITHNHIDHGPGLIEFFTKHHSQYDLQYMMYNMASMRDYYESFLSKSKAFTYFPNLKLHRVHTGETLKLGGVEIDILYTLEDIVIPAAGTIATTDDNDFSVQYRFRFDGIKLWVTGDIHQGGERTMIEMYQKSDLKVDAFQSPHHGYNNNVKMFEAANPYLTMFSADKAAAAEYKNGEAYRNLIANTVGGESSCYFEGHETFGVEVVNGVAKVVFREKIYY